jgi:hypothetical protein
MKRTGAYCRRFILRSGWREVGISILTDLQDGQVGKGLLDLMTKVVRTQLRRLPAAYASRSFDDDLVDDVVQDFVDQRWERTVTALLAQATDDVAIERMLHVIVYRWLVDEVRKTDRGSVRRRLHDHLTAEAMFAQVPARQPGAGQWQLTGTAESTPWDGRLEDLVAAARSVPAKAIRWSDQERRPPITAAADLTAVFYAVMTAAGHQSLEEQALVEVIVRRFPATLDPESRVLDQDRDELAAASAGSDVAWQVELDASEHADAAAGIVAQLTADERRLLPLILDVTAVQTYLGCGRSTAYTRIAKIKDLVRELAGTCDDPEQVILRVLDLCQVEVPVETSSGPAVALDDLTDASSVTDAATRLSARGGASS